MKMYALVPVRVLIQANSAAEISKANDYVNGMVEIHNEANADDKTMDGYLVARDPENDPIQVVTVD